MFTSQTTSVETGTSAQPKREEIWAQPGPQHQFFTAKADIALFGGAAGGGKTYGLVIEPLRHRHNPGFGCVTFRKTSLQIRQEGGLWDSSQFYHQMGARPRETFLEWIWPAGCRFKYSYMQYDQDRFDWDGAQIPLIMFDQLEHFSWKQFSYMFSRNRSLCGVRPYIRATCNPDPDHWLRGFLAWWVDDDTGYAIEERSGKIRWFITIEDEVIWADTKEELTKKYGDKVLPKSFTFIRSNVLDNKILLGKNPEYLANLMALPLIERERLRFGNWNIREQAGTFFRREWFEMVDAAPGKLVSIVRYWDRAVGEDDDSSYTAGVKIAKCSNGYFWVLDSYRFRGSAGKVEQALKNIASQDGRDCLIGIEQDPGQAGKVEAQLQVRGLAGYKTKINVARESKGTRAKPFSAQVEAGNVKVVRGPWNKEYLNELENFDGTDKRICDQVDASSGAFFLLTGKRKAGTWGA